MPPQGSKDLLFTLGNPGTGELTYCPKYETIGSAMTKLEQFREVYTPEQAAQFLQLNRETVYRYIKEGKLGAARLGRAIRIPRRSLELLLLSHSIRSSVTLREYTADQLAEFATEDALDGNALDVARRFDAAHGLGFFAPEDTATDPKRP